MTTSLQVESDLGSECTSSTSTSTITHSTIFECPKLDDIRGVFLQKLETILPETRNMTNADCLALLMGDDPGPPQEIENGSIVS